LSKRPYLAKALRQRIVRNAKNRCGYCLTPQRFFSARLSVEHIIPLFKGGTSDEDNLWLSCQACNWYKSTKTHGRDPVSGKMFPLFNPRQQHWVEHFAWQPDGVRIIGKTPTGRATVITLQLNNDLALAAQRFWVAARKFPPADSLS
jgi:hypothetical protein